MALTDYENRVMVHTFKVGERVQWCKEWVDSINPRGINNQPYYSPKRRGTVVKVIPPAQQEPKCPILGDQLDIVWDGNKFANMIHQTRLRPVKD